MALLDTLIAFIPMLGILIFVHELGHYLVARACGVRVLTFSLGFGPPIGFGDYRLRWERGGTEYRVAWVPLGGYVKMLGEELDIQGEQPDSETVGARPDESLNSKGMWQKLAISFGGPAMNLVFPIFLLVIALMIGMPRASSVIGTVDSASPASRAGLEAGDHLLAINGVPMRFWEDVEDAVRGVTTGSLQIEVERDGDVIGIAVPVEVQRGLNELGLVEERGWIGIENSRLTPLVAVRDLNSPAAVAGLLSGDLVVKVGGVETVEWSGFVDSLAANAGQTVTLEVLRGAEATEPIAIDLVASTDPAELGVLPASVLVASVVEGSAAADGGIRAGDLLLSVGGREISSFRVFADIVRSSEGRELKIGYARGGEVHFSAVQPRLETRDTGFANMTEDVYVVGVSSHSRALPGVYETEQYTNPFVALPRATELSWRMTVSFLKGLREIFSGNVAMDTIAGPIGIAQVARTTLDYGWYAYFSMMMFISINLGVANLLPIPVLDGGQMLIYLVEGIKRSPLSRRTREVVMSIGLVMILML
ncbi:MAG: RIP metalloprotease RseP, partial [Myxococcota bacterium]|nr:RIP metalloprotease RseP [Myxococcota bacterium]